MQRMRIGASFQGEMAKRILKLPKWFSNTAAKIALGWSSMHSICTIRKLKYLSRIGAKEDGISYRAFSSLVDEVESLCLVKECRELEERYKVDYTSKILVSEPEDMQARHHQGDGKSRSQRRSGTPAAVCLRVQTSLQDH